MLQLPRKAGTPKTRLVELPGRGVTRVWECAGPPDAPTLMLIHGVTVTAELNWGKVFAPLSRHFQVVAMDLRGHGDGIRVGWRFRLEDCADDVAALAALGVSIVSGIGAASVVFWFLAKVLLARESALDPADYDMVGVLGKLSIPIRAGGTGELVYSQEGTRHVAGARAEDGVPIPKGVEVMVTRYEKGIAYVRPWQDPAEEWEVKQ